MRKVIPAKVRIPAYIVLIASFVTVVQLCMEAYTFDLYKALGIFIPLIVVNCIILGRAEAFAGRNPILPSLVDGAGMGLGFTLSLFVLGSVRELFGAGSILGVGIFGASLFALAPHDSAAGGLYHPRPASRRDESHRERPPLGRFEQAVSGRQFSP